MLFPAERSVYVPSASSRIAGLIGTGAVLALVAAGCFLTLDYAVPAQESPALVVFDVNPPASPPEIPPEEKEALRPVVKKDRQPEIATVEPVVRSIISVAPLSISAPAATFRPADPGPVEPETAAPRTMAAPPAPQVANNVPDSWEGRILAQLNEHRRYPYAAMARRQQGVPYIRFLMDRKGRVLSVNLERSSGYPSLDREAVALPGRAQPLPKPPADFQPERAVIELVVPVQFFLN